LHDGVSVAELGVVLKYHYWSDRRVRRIAEDNGVSLTTRWPWTFRTPVIPVVGQVEIGEAKRDLRRNEVANKIESAVGLHAVEDIVTPPPVHFAKGTDHIEFASFLGTYAINESAVMHIRTTNSLDQTVDLCLFGSMDNFSGYI
jgi:hypothetical protein